MATNLGQGPIISPPKYEQLRRYLYDEIRNGIFGINSRLPAEDDLARRFGIARGTVRQAIQRLEKDGIVETVHGVGTFVRRRTRFTSTRMISFISTDSHHDAFTNEFYQPILTSAVREARRHRIKILYTSFTPEEIAQDEDLFLSYVGEACIIVRKLPEWIIAALHENRIPFVFIGNAAKTSRENAVIADNESGGYLATEYLIQLGHKRIVHIEHDMSTISGPARRDGYLRALRDHGIPTNRDLIVRSDSRERSRLYDRLDGLSSRGIAYTAVFAASDHRALLAMDYFREKGVRVPDDVSVIGFDNLSISAHAPYSLTTVNVDKELMGRAAIDLALKLLDDPGRAAEVVTTTVALVERSSCARLRPKGQR